MAKWLKARPEVESVLHPAFEDCPGPRTSAEGFYRLHWSVHDHSEGRVYERRPGEYA